MALHRSMGPVNIHIPYAFVYSDSTARISATGFTVQDEGKLARQLDDDSLWMLTDCSPVTWVPIGTVVPPAAGEANTASNIGAGGIGFYKQKVGVDLQFKNLNAASSKITLVDDVANSEVDIDVDESNIIHQNLSGAGTHTHGQIDAHISDTTSNPHQVEFLELSDTPSSYSGQADRIVFVNSTEDGLEFSILNIDDIIYHIDNTAIHFLEHDIDHKVIQNIGINTHDEIDAHISDTTSNPHMVTYLQVGAAPTHHTHVEADITDLDHNALKIQGVPVDPSGIADGKVLVYDSTTGTLQYEFVSDETAIGANVGVGGVGLYKQKVSNVLQFKNINAGSNKVTITDDVPNNEVDIDINESNIIHQSLSGAGVHTHAEIDTHIDSTAIHFLEHDIDHTTIQNIGVNTHDQIDAHIADTTSNPHMVTLEDVGGVPLAYIQGDSTASQTFTINNTYQDLDIPSLPVTPKNAQLVGTTQLKVLVGGVFRLSYSVSFERSGSASNRNLNAILRINGTTYITNSETTGKTFFNNDGLTLTSSSHLVDLSANDYVTVRAKVDNTNGISATIANLVVERVDV